MGEIVLLCPEPVRDRVQGIGIRFLEMAQALRRHGHRVSVWVPNEDIPPEKAAWMHPVWSSSFRVAVRQCEAVILHGHISELYFAILEQEGLKDGPPLIVDLYDPFVIENLQYTPTLGEWVYERDRGVLLRQLQAGDFFLASSEAQRLFYIGLLIGTGRLTPRLYHDDPTLRSWIAVVPFGVHPVDPQRLQDLPGKIKGVLPGIGPQDVVIFFGGVYEWYDPLLLLEAVEPLIDKGWPLRILFCRNPNPETTPQGKLEAVCRWAEAKRWMDRHVFVLPWFSYDERFHFYRDVDIAVSLHRPSLETELSLRTRLLDYMNAGLPIIATEGGEGSARVLEAGAGLVVPPGDGRRLQEALETLLVDEDRRRLCGERGRQWIQKHMTWDRSLRPLVNFCQDPKKRPSEQSPQNSRDLSPLSRQPQLGFLLREIRHHGLRYGFRGAARRLWQLWRRGA
uniref:Glycosyltransferase n=1 Tax=Desulfacinum infernum TaxID=35837 RepID=A0A832A860_9BACT